MVISHNMAAENAASQTKKVQTDQRKSTEKLSTGYRINRSADDAAGLSISEKMRQQLRGLDKASHNLQDGMSLTQIADGALNETHAILQRMRELSVQAANDTNTTADRGAIQKEINQLADQVDSVAYQTNFNDAIYPLLAGSAVGSYLPDSNYASVLDHYSFISDPVMGPNGGIGMYIPGMHNYAGAIGGYGNNGHALIQATLADGSKTAPVSMFQSPGTSGTITTNRTVTPELMTFEYEDSSNGVHFKVDITCRIVNENDPETMKGGQYFLSSFEIENLGVPFQNMDILLHTDPINGAMRGSPSYNGSSMGTHPFAEKVDPTKDYSFVCSPSAYSAYTNCDVTAKLTGDYIPVPPDIAYAGSDLVSSNQPNLDMMNDIKNDTYHPSSAHDYHFAAAWLGRSLNTGASFTASTMFGLSYPIKMINRDSSITPDGIWIQCGSNAHDGLRVPLVDATAATLKIKDPYPDVSSYRNASNSIVYIDYAIDTVSRYRSDFGSYQNAMEHMKLNNENVGENVQTSESRIRDTNMAAELVSFAKNQILAQAGDAMVSQARQQPEALLRLLE